MQYFQRQNVYDLRGLKEKEMKRMKPKMDMLNGSIWNKIIQYALPVAATGILEQLFNASDLAIVGNFTLQL